MLIYFKMILESSSKVTNSSKHISAFVRQIGIFEISVKYTENNLFRKTPKKSS